MQNIDPAGEILQAFVFPNWGGLAAIAWQGCSIAGQGTLQIVVSVDRTQYFIRYLPVSHAVEEHYIQDFQPFTIAGLTTQADFYDIIQAPIREMIKECRSEQQIMLSLYWALSSHSLNWNYYPLQTSIKTPREMYAQLEKIGIAPITLGGKIDSILEWQPWARISPLVNRLDSGVSTIMNTYHVSGPNSRININSHDQSINNVTITPQDLFRDIKSLIEASETEETKRTELLVRLAEMERTQRSPAFLQHYTAFMSLAADHMSILAPLLPALSELLH